MSEVKLPTGRPKKSNPKTLVGFRLRPEQVEGLRRMAEEQDLPQSIIIRRAIDRVLKEGFV